GSAAATGQRSTSGSPPSPMKIPLRAKHSCTKVHDLTAGRISCAIAISSGCAVVAREMRPADGATSHGRATWHRDVGREFGRDGRTRLTQVNAGDVRRAHSGNT